MTRSHPLCELCGTRFRDEQYLEEHFQEYHVDRSPSPSLISMDPDSQEKSTEKGDENNDNDDGNKAETKTTQRANFQLIQQAFRGSIKTYRYIPNDLIDPRNLFNEIGDKTQDVLESTTRKMHGIKWYLCAHAEFVRFSSGSRERATLYVRSTTEKSYELSDFRTAVAHACEKIQQTIETMEIRGSGWAIERIAHVDLHVVDYVPYEGGSYIALPKWLSENHGQNLLNPRNTDEKCFRYSVLAALYWRQIRNREARLLPQSYERFASNHDFSMLSENDATPLRGIDIRHFEETNNISVNVFGYEEKAVFPIYISELVNARSEVDLLYISRGERGHYVAIKSLAALIAAQTQGNRHQVCRRCLQRFRTQHQLTEHSDLCAVHRPSAITFRPEGEMIKFTNLHRQLRVGAAIYADIESLLVPVDDENDDDKNDDEKAEDIDSSETVGHSETDETGSLRRRPAQHLQRHTACAASALFIADDPAISGRKFQRRVRPMRDRDITVHDDGDVEEAVSYSSFDLMSDLIGFFQECAQTAYENSRKHMVMTKEDEVEFQAARSCHVCGVAYTHTDVRTRDHDHWTGRYRGSAHQKCNVLLRLTSRLPVFFHGLRKYDSHLLLRTMAELQMCDALSVIPHNSEQYISFSLTVTCRRVDKDFAYPPNVKTAKMKLVFTDTYAFVNRPLAEMARNLDSFPLLESELSPATVEKLTPLLDRCNDRRLAVQLLTEKGVLPYDYLTDELALDETELPPKKAFYSLLHERHISDEEYARAQRVWSAFECRNLGEYLEVYLACDVLLLAEVFEKFRRTCHDAYGLDPAHYLTTAALTWDACLKLTGVELEPIRDADIHLFIESAIRGGVAQVSHRYAKANNRQAAFDMHVDYRSDQPTTYIIYLDMNNLYGTAMTKPLPCRNLRWLIIAVDNHDETMATAMRLIENYSEQDPIGYILEVDLDYPERLHDAHNDLPLAPERMHPPEISPLTAAIAHHATGCGERYATTSKLISHLGPRRNYIVHVAALQYYLSQGMQLVRAHRILEFEQSAWIRPYIESNTLRRMQCSSAFEKDFYKLMNNALYGKTIENVRKRTRIQLVDTVEQLRAHVKKPTYKRHIIFSESFIGIEKRFLRVELNKPIYVGMSILDLSKVEMFRFHYGHMMQRYGHERCRLLMTDTDSFIYHIQTDDVYADMLEDRDRWFDTSDYPRDHPLYSTLNKKRLGMMKDEMAGRYIRQFVGLRAKVYALATSEHDEIKRAKGVARNIVSDRIGIEHYLAAIFGKAVFDFGQRTIESHGHQLMTVERERQAICAVDDKRYVADCNIRTYAHGHKDLPVVRLLSEMVSTVADTDDME